MKRLLDVALATVMMVISSPVWILLAVAIKLEDGGPILFNQRRWGMAGSQFALYKFRSMHPSAAEVTVDQIRENDPRVTRIGRILRATGLDELPQLLNILKGDMSFVGPRALAVAETIEIEPGRRIAYEDMPDFEQRLKARPGLTGMATVYVPKTASPGIKFEYDLRYISERSLALDVKLIALSFWISFRGKWETRGSKF